MTRRIGNQGKLSHNYNNRCLNKNCYYLNRKELQTRPGVLVPPASNSPAFCIQLGSQTLQRIP